MRVPRQSRWGRKRPQTPGPQGGPWLFLVAVALAGCKGRDAAPLETPSASPLAEPVVSARRPVRRYYLARQPTHCEIYFSDPDRDSPVQAVPCPLYLEIGERIRIAGKTCVREGGAPDRVMPVVCPDPLTNLEKRERGELQ